LVDHLFVFEGDGAIRDFPGNYSQYRLWKEDAAPDKENIEEPVSAQPVGTKIQQTATRKRLSYKEKREFEMLGKEIEDLNAEREVINKKFNEGARLSFEELQQLSQRIGELSSLLDAKELRWLELSEMMDESG